MDVAFCGLGRMGVAMARHVPDAGHSLTVWNRSPGEGYDLVAAGATEADSPSAARDAIAAGHARDDYSALAGYLADEAGTR